MVRFLSGFLFGGATVYFALHFHVVRADDGVHFVPKVTTSFSQPYVDVRGFTVTDWADHQALSLAIENAEKRDLFSGSISQSIKNSVEDVFDSTIGN